MVKITYAKYPVFSMGNTATVLIQGNIVCSLCFRSVIFAWNLHMSTSSRQKIQGTRQSLVREHRFLLPCMGNESESLVILRAVLLDQQSLCMDNVMDSFGTAKTYKVQMIERNDEWIKQHQWWKKAGKESHSCWPNIFVARKWSGGACFAYRIYLFRAFALFNNSYTICMRLHFVVCPFLVAFSVAFFVRPSKFSMFFRAVPVLVIDL